LQQNRSKKEVPVSTQSDDERIKALEGRVARLAEFNEFLLGHVLRVQSIGPLSPDPASQKKVNVWLIDLSDGAAEKYRYNKRF
jgi:hypothetical protein